MTFMDVYTGVMLWSKEAEPQFEQYEHDFWGLMHDKYGYVERNQGKGDSPPRIPLGVRSQARAFFTKDERLLYVARHEERNSLTVEVTLAGNDRGRLEKIMSSIVRFHDSRGYMHRGRISF